MTASEPAPDPSLGRILYSFEPPSLFQMVAGLIGAALGWGLYSVWGEFLMKVTLTVVGLGTAAFFIGLWRYSEQVQFGERGVRRRKWGGSAELLYDEIAAVSHVKSESVDRYSSLQIEARDGKPAITFYRFEEPTFPEAERVMVAAVVAAIEQRLNRGEPCEWLPEVRFTREGLELSSSSPQSPARVVPYREVGSWVPGEGGLTLKSKAGDPLLTTTLDGRNFIVCYHLLARLTTK